VPATDREADVPAGGLTTQGAVLELQARARDRALEVRLARVERLVARVHARLDGAEVTFAPGVLRGPGSPSDPPR
jgi:hypothetical protein